MSTLYQSSKDVPTEVLSARLNKLSDVVSRNRERIDAEFTMRIPAEVDRDADLVMSEAAVRLEALQAECEELRKDAERYRFARAYENDCFMLNTLQVASMEDLDSAIDDAMQRDNL